MRNNNRFFPLLAAVAISSLASVQAPPPSTPASHRVSVFAGSLAVPSGCSSVTLESWVDTWAGRLEGQCPALHFVAGHPLRYAPTKADRHLYDTFAEEAIGSRTLLYGIRKTGSAFTVHAHIGLVNFTFTGADKAAVEAALRLIRTFGECKGCPWPPRKPAA
jgi:hypothetical protein